MPIKYKHSLGRGGGCYLLQPPPKCFTMFIPHNFVWVVSRMWPNKAVLNPRVSPAFGITYFCNHCNIRFENASKYVDTLTLFSKNLNQRSLTPRWPLTPCLLRSHVWLYPRIIVSKSHDMHQCMRIQWLILLNTTYRMSDHIVSYWTQFRRDKKECYAHQISIFECQSP